MLKRFNELSFVIGLFFFIVSLVLLVSAMVSENFSGKINIYTGAAFFIFGLSMMIFRGKKAEE